MTKLRVITALVLAPLMIFGIFFLPLKQFAIFIAVIATLGAWEWANIAGYRKNWSRVLYAAVMFICLYLTARFLKVNEQYLIYFLAVGTLWWAVAFALVKQYPGGTELWHARPNPGITGIVCTDSDVGGFYAPETTATQLVTDCLPDADYLGSGYRCVFCRAQVG